MAFCIYQGTLSIDSFNCRGDLTRVGANEYYFGITQEVAKSAELMSVCQKAAKEIRAQEIIAKEALKLELIILIYLLIIETSRIKGYLIENKRSGG
jgi:hypothetical protein